MLKSNAPKICENENEGSENASGASENFFEATPSRTSEDIPLENRTNNMFSIDL